MQISQETLEQALYPYRKECKLLKKAEFFYPEINGIFEIPHSFYLNQGLISGHFNAVDLILCYNQLSYSFFTEAIKQKLIPEIQNISNEEFKQLQLEACLITSINEIKFRKPIIPDSFLGKLKLDKIKKINENYFCKTSIDFENGKAAGNVDLALILKK
jgi:hypothetical protein